MTQAKKCVHNLETIIFSIYDFKIWKISVFFYLKKAEKIFLCKTGSVYPIPVLHILSGSTKHNITFHYIYWAKSATLTAYHSQFRNNYFSISDSKN